MGQPLLPDIPNWCWHEYGMRVGFWRFLDVLNARRLKATLAVNGTACQLYAPACQAALDAGWEFMGHGHAAAHASRGRPGHGDPRHHRRHQGLHRPRAALPGLTETDDTIDPLAEAGIEYVADWVLDDQPVPIRTRSGDILSVPYTVELNDVVISAVQLRLR